MIDPLLDAVAARLEGDTDVDSSWIPTARLVHLGSRWEGRATFVLFAASDPSARLITKTDRTLRGRRQLEREHDALSALAAVPELAGTTPRSLALFDHGGGLVLVQAALPGRSLVVDLRRRLVPTARRIRRDHDLVLTWLHRLQASTPRMHASGSRRLETDEILGAAEQVLPTDEEWAARTLLRLAALGAEIGTVGLPLARNHGDLGPSNILVARGRLGVIDWEGASAHAPVLNDVLMFLHHYARAIPRPTGGMPDRFDVAADVFLGSDVLARETWTRWTAEVGRAAVPSRAARYVLLAILLQLASGTTEFAHRDRGGAMWTEITRRYARAWARQGFPLGAGSPPR